MIELLRIIHKIQSGQFHEGTISSLLNRNVGNVFATNQFRAWAKTFIHTEQWWTLYYTMADKQLETSSDITRALTHQRGSARPSSCTLVSGSVPVPFSSATEWVYLCLPGGFDLTERPWRRILLFQSGCPSGHFWAVCTCTPRWGRCRGKWPWSQLQEEINKPLIHPEEKKKRDGGGWCSETEHNWTQIKCAIIISGSSSIWAIYTWLQHATAWPSYGVLRESGSIKNGSY